MIQSFGAGFFVLTVVSVLALLAAAGTLLAALALTLRARSDTVQVILRSAALLLALVVLLITTFGAVVTYDEAPAALWIFLGTVILPLTVVAVERTRVSTSTEGAVATAALAWAPAFVLAVAVLAGLLARTDVAFTGATALAGAVATVGSLLVGRQLGTVHWLGAASDGA